MNCPCSSVYVCAYIVLFFSPTASKKKSGLDCSFFFSCPLWFWSYLKGKRTAKISSTQQLQTSRLAAASPLFIGVQFTFRFHTFNNLIWPLLFWTYKQINWLGKSSSRECRQFMSGWKEHQQKWEKAVLVTLTSHCQTLAEVYLGSCCLAWDSDGVGIQYSALPRQPTQTSALPPHHHFAQHQTTKLACSAAPMANPKN